MSDKDLHTLLEKAKSHVSSSGPLWRDDDEADDASDIRSHWLAIGFVFVVAALVVVIPFSLYYSVMPAPASSSSVDVTDVKDVKEKHIAENDAASFVTSSSDERLSSSLSSSPVPTQTPLASPSSVPSSSADVDPNIVIVNMPTSVAGIFTQDAVSRTVSDNGWISGTLNDNGVIVYEMTPQARDTALSQTKANLNEVVSYYQGCGVLTGCVLDGTVLTVTVASSDVSSDFDSTAQDLLRRVSLCAVYQGYDVNSVRLDVQTQDGIKLNSYVS